MIKISSLGFQYPQSSQPALNGINLEIQPGTLTLVTGASGSGKSTLLRCINGLVPHFSGGVISGNIIVYGLDPIKEGPEKMASKVGFVFQEPEAQFVFDIVEDEIAFALENAGMPRERMQTRVNETIHQLKLEAIRFKNIHELSGGEQQKVAIASALVRRPQVLILDEPTSQFDPSAADELLTYITHLKDVLQLTVLISEHRLERLLPFTDTIAHLTDNGDVLFGKPQKVLVQMDQTPPIIQIARHLNINPLPLCVENFPNVKLTDKNRSQKPYHLMRSTQGTAPLKVSNLTTHINGQCILNQINLQLKQGEILTLIGQNGAGKTTLLRSILGLLPANGQRLLYGKIMHELAFSQIIRHIAYLPQNPNDLLFAESIMDELKVTIKNHNLMLNDSDLSAFLAKFGLDQLKDRYPRDLSVGERQRTALAAITIHKPEIIFLDEPTRGMDYRAKDNLTSILRRWRTLKKSILLVTHDVEFAAGIADRVVILENREIIFNGSPKKAFTDFPTFQTQTARLFPNTGWITATDFIES